jgi:carbon starvation protein
LWPIFGIANQLLAVIAFCLGTTIIIKMGRVRQVWVTVMPLMFLVAVTFTAGWMKLFSVRAAGFVPALEKLEAQIVDGTAPATAARSLLNLRVDIGITVFFLLAVGVIVVASVVEWARLLRGRKQWVLRESAFVALADGRER